MCCDVRALPIGRRHRHHRRERFLPEPRVQRLQLGMQREAVCERQECALDGGQQARALPAEIPIEGGKDGMQPVHRAAQVDPHEAHRPRRRLRQRRAAQQEARGNCRAKTQELPALHCPHLLRNSGLMNNNESAWRRLSAPCIAETERGESHAPSDSRAIASGSRRRIRSPSCSTQSMRVM
ncbi:MAG: hypothetical protein ACK559_04590, partial [bacterium]